MDGADHVGEPVTARLVAAALVVLATSLPAAAQDSGPPPVRNVTPPGMTPGPVVDGPLVREETPPPPPEAARWRRFLLPRTTDSATFVTEGLAIRVSGVTPPPADRVCEASDGGEAWPCGRVALFSLRMFLRGRPVECYFPPLGDVRQVIAPCRVGATDLGLWLLAQGWAEPDGNATDEYRKAAVKARCARRGLYRDTPSDGTCPAGD